MTAPLISPSEPSLEPSWLPLARADLGTRETAGPAVSPRVVDYFRAVGHDWVTSDETAWCAAFLGACLERSGIASTRSLAARSYLSWGEPISEPRPGAIAVFSRGINPRLGHVGFVVAHAPDHLLILGGNQNDSVSVVRMPRRRLLGLRWPITARGPGETGTFPAALAHILRFEGGWSDDPNDPGGATYRGITLATYAADRAQPLNDRTRPDLVRQLRGLSDSAVSDLYFRRYWVRAACDRLHPALAVMQFDTAVNQGPVTAIRLLQAALGVSVDGDAGPQTLGAASAAPLTQTIQRYAAARRQRYRSTRNFARFGRGWLARLSATLSLARSLVTTTQPTQHKEMSPMTQQPKWWGRSLTIWGAIITACSTVIPVIGPLFGIDLSAADILRFGDNVSQVLQAIGGILGTALTIYGRFRADSPLERRQLTVAL